MAISASLVKELRTKTGCGFMSCKEALTATDGDIEKAVEYLRKKGIATAEKKGGRETSEGLIYSYIHGNGRIGVLLEINCETDFVARTDEFKDLTKEIAMQIAAFNPQYVNKEDVPEEEIEKEKDIYRAQFKDTGKPAEIVEKIISGKLEKNFFAQKCLLEQQYIRDDKKIIKDIVKEKIGKLGENIQIKRFVRFERGEG
ncbi:MAG: translation elongation factor Ts [bacterium]